MELQVRRASVLDAEVILSLGRQTFFETFADSNSPEDMEKYLSENFSQEQVKSELMNGESVFFVVFSDDEAVAYMKVNSGSAQTEPQGNDALEIQRIYVLAAHKRKGIGKILMAEAEKEAKRQGLSKLWLGVWEHNEKAKAFYKNLGFKKFSEHVFVLGQDRQTDFLMEKYL